MDVVYNLRRRARNGPDLELPGASTNSAITVSRRTSRATPTTRPVRQHAQRCPSLVLRMASTACVTGWELMHIDGFRSISQARFGREYMEFDREGGFFDAIRRILSWRCEADRRTWDVGEGGYHSAASTAVPRNGTDRFRDDVRRFWKGDGGMVPVLAERILGSPVQFRHSTVQRPRRSTVSAHDGFTLMDTVSYGKSTTRANARRTGTVTPKSFRQHGRRGPDRQRGDHQARKRRAAPCSPP